ncbi:MAG: helix-turn-helix domain-containing protein [Solirubrobacteraceae bacterium]
MVQLASIGSAVGLLELEPDLGRFLAPEERAEARKLTVPVLSIQAGPVDLDRVLHEAGAFGAVIIDGVLLERLTLGGHATLRLLGHGDVLAREGTMPAALSAELSHRSAGTTRLGLLDNRMLAAGLRFPQLFAGLHVRMSEQSRRLGAQLAICQLPRVNDRILSMLWLLADTWGRVTPSGTMLRLALTHDALGELVGARRSTVTLALKELRESGAVIRHNGEWLLLEPDPERGTASQVLRDDAVWTLAHERIEWIDDGSIRGDRPAVPERSLDALKSLVAALQDRHGRMAEDVRSRLETARAQRDRSLALREQFASRRAALRPQAPSA